MFVNSIAIVAAFFSLNCFAAPEVVALPQPGVEGKLTAGEFLDIQGRVEQVEVARDTPVPISV